MTDLPSGTVTFLFTDIEGSSTLWERHRDAMAIAVSRQEELLSTMIVTHRGRVFKSVGDGVCAVFASASDAVRAALAAQRALLREAWPVPGGIRVRMGLHTGHAEQRGDDYAGPTVNREARVLTAAHGGQIVISEITRQLVIDDLPSDVTLRDLGEWELKGLARAERLFALHAPDLPKVFAGGRTRPAARKTVGPTALRQRRWIGAALLLPIAAVLYVVLRNRPPATDTAARADEMGIVVLPFQTTGPGLELYGEGMVDMLTTNFRGVPGLRTIDSRTAISSWRTVSEARLSGDESLAQTVARQTGARHAVVGSAVATEEHLRLTADVLDVERGRIVANGQVEGPVDSLIPLVDGLSVSLVRELVRDPRRRPGSMDVGRATTTSLAALKAYLEGESLLRHSDYEGAIAAYQQAVEADSTFALALYRLATAHGWAEIIESDADRRIMERAALFAERLTPRDSLMVVAKLAFWRGTLEGLEPLREAVRQQPQDVEARYLLGETSFHLGRQALAGQHENDDAFERVIELDSSFAPAYVHLIENAFNYHADSARAQRFVELYRNVTEDSEASRLSHVAWSLAFGDSSTRAATRAKIRSLAPRSLLGVALHLWHPRFAAIQEDILEHARQSAGPEAADAVVLLFLSAYLRGHLEEAVRYLDEPSLPAGYREAGLYVVYATRLPTITAEHLDIELAGSATDSFPYLRTFYGGAYAADRERWDDHRRATDRLRTEGTRLLVDGDSTAARFVQGMARGLHGHGLARRDQPREALAELRAGQRLATAWPPLEIVNATLRLWLSRLLVDTGEFEEAERYAETFWQDPLASFWLAQIYEQRERYDLARRAYLFFIDGWKDADLDLQPLVEQARRAAARLPQSIDES